MTRPTHVGPYEVEGVLGAGGMGIVYRARGPDGRPVALKVLRSALLRSELVRRFEQEARVRVDHPNVIRVLDAGVDGQGTPFIGFELLDGEPFSERLARGPLTASEVIDLGEQVCRGLSAAHQQGIVHRDLKPSNVFLCVDGTVKVLDFGIALLSDGHTRLTQTGAVPGTVGYLSPEQCEGRAIVDARSDLWSLGALLYEAAAGAPPFEEGTPLATIVATLMGEPTSLHARAPGAPPELCSVIDKALARDPDARWATADAFGRALCSARDAAPGSRAGKRSAGADIAAGQRRVVAVVLAVGVRDLHEIDTAVRREGGDLLRLLGHRALAVFGAHEWNGDEVLRAARTARGLRPFAERVSVASGWATAAASGIAGEALRSAERGVELSVDGVVVDSESTRLLTDGANLVPLGDGFHELGLEPPRPTQASDRTPLLGRQVELAQLELALHTVLSDRRPIVVLVRGGAGIGKSRLRLAMEDLISGSGLPMGRLALAASFRSEHVAFEPFASLLRNLLPQPIHGPAATAALRTLIAQTALDQRRVSSDAEALGHLLAAAPTRPGLSQQDLTRNADRVRLALLSWLEGMAANGPLAILVEDLHSMDSASLELMEELMERTEGALLLLATARTSPGPASREEEPEPFAGCDVIRVAPRGLVRADVARLARATAGCPLDSSLTRALAERTQGNPFFVIQTVRALQDEELLSPGAGNLPLPVSVEAAVQSRLDHLDALEKEVCCKVAVWRRAFSAAEASALIDRPVGSALATLVERDILHVRRFVGGTYVFRSPLMADVALRMLTDSATVELHRRAAAHLGSLPAPDLEELGRHHEGAGDTGPAASAHGLAAQLAAQRGDVDAALRCSQRAFSLGVADDERFALHVVRVDALRFLGRKAEQGQELSSAYGVATTDAQLAQAASERAVWLWRSGDTPGALSAAEEAVSAARRSGDDRAIVLACGRQFLVSSQTSQSQESEDALLEAEERSKGMDRSVRALVLSWRAHRAAASGDLGQRLHVYNELVDVYEELGDRRRAAGAAANLADVYNRLGAYADSSEALESALDDCRRVGHRTMEGYTLLNLGYARTGLGQMEAAFEALLAAAALAEQAGEVRLLALTELYRSRALLRTDQPDEALSLARRAARRAADTGAADVEAGSLVVAAQALLRLGHTEEAHACSLAAVEICERLGGLEEDEADVYLAHAAAHRTLGREDEATAILTRARERLATVASGISDPVLRRRLLEDVPSHRELALISTPVS